MRNPSPGSAARVAFATLLAIAIALPNMAAGCPGDGPPPIDLPEVASTAAVGTLTGSSAVSDDGTFSYTIPIPMPPGRAGMQPSLAISYASTPAESSLGVGFRLDGLSAITRCGQSVAVDGQHHGVHLDEDDRLCLDGARLLAVEGVDLSPGAVYRTESESWRRVETLSSDAAGISGPLGFLVRLPDGRERLYGATNGSQQVITRADGTRVVATWYLAQERDPRGNAIQYRYQHVTPTLPPAIADAADPDPPVHDTVRIARIDYTGTASADGALAVNGTRSVRFVYAATPRLPDVGISPPGSATVDPGPEDGFVHGSYGWRASVFPLERVRTYVGDELVHELRLEGDGDSAARRYRLSSAELCSNAPAAPGSAGDGGLVCLPRTRFEWRHREALGPIVDARYARPTFESHDVPFDGAQVRRRTCVDDQGGQLEGLCDTPWPLVALDADGDGADDLLYLRDRYRGDRPRRDPRLSIRYGGYAARSTASLVAGEAPLERTRDVVLVPDVPERDVAGIAERLEWADSIDWNVDGRDDLVLIVPAAGENLWELIVAVASGGARFQIQSTGLFIPQLPGNAEFHDGGQTGHLMGLHVRRSVEVLDLDGDGRRDVMACLNDGIAHNTYFDGHENLTSVSGRWWYALRNSDGSLGTLTSAGRRRLAVSGLETNCGFEYGGLRIITPTVPSPDFPAVDFQTRVLDADGDGMEELLIAPPWFTRHPGERAPSTNVRRARWDGSRLVAEWANVVNERFEILDVNGDGLHDLVAEHASMVPPHLAHLVPSASDEVLTLVYLSRGDGSFVPYVPSVAVGDVRRAVIRPATPLAPAPGLFDRAPLSMFPFDANGDGRGDLITLHVQPWEVRPEVRETAGSAYRVEGWAIAAASVVELVTSTDDVTYSAGLAIAGEQRAANFDPHVSTIYTTRSTALDADGDGALDLVTAARIGDFGDDQPPFPRPNVLSLHHNVRALPALVERITDGLGVRTIVEYTPLSDSTVYQPSRDCAHPTRCTTDSRYVVQRLRSDSGLDLPDVDVEEEHFYQGGRADLLGRGFLGFQRHVIRNTTTNEVVDRRFDNQTYDAATRSYPRAGRPRAVMHFRMHLGALADGMSRFVGTKETFEHRLEVTDVGTHYTVVESSRSRAYEELVVPLAAGFRGDPFLGLVPARDVSRTFTYDPFGNRETTVERVIGVSGTVVTSATWINDTSLWRIGLPGTRSIRTNEADQACSLNERTRFGVDVALAELTSITRLGDASVERTTTLFYDDHGNVDGATVTSDEDPRSVRLTYDPTGYFVETAQNALGHLTTVRHEPRFGAVVHETDPNGVETARSFDGFGRLRAERTTGRGGVEVSYDLADEVGRHQVRVDHEGGGHEVVELDRLGRAVFGIVEHATVTSYMHRSFDRLGHLVAQSEPYTDPSAAGTAPLAVSYVYDDIGRVLSAVGADGEQTTYGYAPRTRRASVVGGGTTVTELDVAGRVLAVTEPATTGSAPGEGSPAGRTSYEYCRSGALRRTHDARGNVTTVEYDDVGRRVFLDDPAAGVARFSYTALDELERTEDAEGRVTRWERDALGRVETLFHDAEGTADRFFFDTAVTPGGRSVLGALASAESADGVIDTYEFDDLARSTGQSRLVDGHLLRFHQELDPFGRVLSTTYPTAIGAGTTQVSNFYDARTGEPYEVRLNGSPVWRLREQDARGAPTRETLGSSVTGVIQRVSRYTDAGRLDRVRSSSGALVLQDLDYDYESRGLLETREDRLDGRTETFVHDELSRLRDVFEGTALREHYVSDELGNLTRTHDSVLVYDDPTRPYAVTELDGPEGGDVLYDEVGNARRVGELTFTYTQRNLPRTISSSKTGLIEYGYDAGGGRATKRGRDVDVTYFGLYQLERRGMLLYERLSIPTPVGVVAQEERVGATGGNQPTSRLRWLLADRQGSTETTWVLGEDPRHHRYDAYGALVTAAGSLTEERPAPTVSHGFTGHEHEDETGLINMGGRVYSPRLRRFLSADPIVAVPFGQGLNAYSYVRGNPLNAVDPFGWQEYREDYSNPGADGEPTIIIRMPVPEREGVGDGPAPERGGAAQAGQAPARATDASPGGGARDLGSPRLHRITADDMAAAAQIIDERGTLQAADWVAHGAAGIAAGALAVFAVAEVGAGGVAAFADQTARAVASSPTIIRAVQVATQLADGVLADAMGGLSPVSVPVLAGAGGVGAHVAGQVVDDVGRAMSRASSAGAFRARAAAELGEPLEEGAEVFLHGTTLERAASFELEPGRRFFTALDPSVARVFADRTVARHGGYPGLVGLVLPRDVVQGLRSQGLLISRHVDDMPGVIEWVFEPGAFDAIQRSGDIVNLGAF